MNNSMKFLCSQIFRLISPGSSWFNKHCPICQSGYGAVASLLQCTHPAVRSPVPAPAVRDMAVVRSPQAVPAVQCLLEQIHCLWLFHIRKKKKKRFNCLSLKDVHGKLISSTEVCVWFWVSIIDGSHKNLST